MTKKMTWLGILWISISLVAAAFTKASSATVTYYYQYTPVVCAAVSFDNLLCPPDPAGGCIIAIPGKGIHQLYRDPPIPGSNSCRTPLGYISE